MVMSAEIRDGSLKDWESGLKDDAEGEGYSNFSKFQAGESARVGDVTSQSST